MPCPFNWYRSFLLPSFGSFHLPWVTPFFFSCKVHRFGNTNMSKKRKSNGSVVDTKCKGLGCLKTSESPDLAQSGRELKTKQK